MTGGQQVGVEPAKRRRRNDHGDLGDARRLGRHDRHQQARRIRGRTAGYADAQRGQAADTIDPARCPIPAPASRRDGGSPSDTSRMLRRTRAIVSRYAGSAAEVCLAQLVGETRICPGSSGTRRAVRVVEHGVEAAGGHVVADPLDDLPRRERLAEGRDRSAVSLRGSPHCPWDSTPFSARRSPRGVVTRTIDSSNLENQRFAFPIGSLDDRATPDPS